MQINVHAYHKHLGGSDANHRIWARHIVGALPGLIPSCPQAINVDVYNMDGKPFAGQPAGHRGRLVIFGNGYNYNARTKDADSPYLAHRDEAETLHFIKDENGHIMVEYDTDNNELYFLFDVFAATDFTAFDNLIRQLEAEVFYPKTLENSWVHGPNKDKIIQRLNESMREQRRDYLSNEKHRIDEYKAQIDEYRRSIKQLLDRIDRTSRRVIAEEQGLDAFGTQILKDLDLIAAHEKVKDIHVKDGLFIVYTNPLYMYTDKEERFYLGEMRIEMNPHNSDVKFFGSNPRRSYWTDHDPHPHVDGGSGHACLGNASALIAELSNQMQIYALTLTCIDFLGQANLDDIAGRNVYHWQMVDEEGNPISGPTEDRPYTCEHCGEPCDETFTVFVELDEDGDPIRERQVCEDCRENEYHWDEDAEVYIQD